MNDVKKKEFNFFFLNILAATHDVTGFSIILRIRGHL